MLGPELRGRRIHLGPLQPEDLPTVGAWLSDPNITWFWGSFEGHSEQQMTEWYERQAASDQHVRWRIAIGGRLIGMTVIEEIDWRNRHAQTGIMIGDRSAWGKGYAFEAVQLRTRYAFEELGLERLESISMAGNAAMHRVLERAGYRRIARMRRYFFRHGQWHDVFLFELLCDEWRASAEPSEST